MINIKMLRETFINSVNNLTNGNNDAGSVEIENIFFGTNRPYTSPINQNFYDTTDDPYLSNIQDFSLQRIITQISNELETFKTAMETSKTQLLNTYDDNSLNQRIKLYFNSNVLNTYFNEITPSKVYFSS